MRSEDPLRAAAERCLSILRRYHNGERTAATKALMIAEVETVVGWLMELRLPPGAADSGVLRPVEDSILSGYGHEAGSRLNTEFIDAFELRGMQLVARQPSSARG